MTILSEILAASGLRPAQLAELAGMTKQQLYRAMRGTNGPSEKLLLRLADAAGVKIEIVKTTPDEIYRKD